MFKQGAAATIIYHGWLPLNQGDSVTADHACGAIQIILPPSPRSYFESLSTSGPGPSGAGYAKD